MKKKPLQISAFNISFNSGNNHKTAKNFNFQAQEIKCNFKDGLADGFWIFSGNFFPRKKFPIYMEPLTKGYWSTEMDHHHNQ